jgi:hypothetical protein
MEFGDQRSLVVSGYVWDSEFAGLEEMGRKKREGMWCAETESMKFLEEAMLRSARGCWLGKGKATPPGFLRCSPIQRLVDSSTMLRKFLSIPKFLEKFCE